LANVGLTVARRSVFVIEPHGNVSWAWLSTKPSDEPNYDDVKKAVEAASAHKH
jgi:peroxiredoxin